MREQILSGWLPFNIKRVDNISQENDQETRTSTATLGD